jgi:hypothetical protein
VAGPERHSSPSLEVLRINDADASAKKLPLTGFIDALSRPVKSKNDYRGKLRGICLEDISITGVGSTKIYHYGSYLEKLRRICEASDVLLTIPNDKWESCTTK